MLFESAWGESKIPGKFVNFVQFEGNALFDHDELAKRVPVGRGTYLSEEFMRLYAEEIRGYYSSHGFHHVIVHPDFRVREGIFTIKIYEKLEQPENPQKAFRDVERMIALDDMELDNVKKRETIQQVLFAYMELDRIQLDKIALQRENIMHHNALQLKEQRERVIENQALWDRIQEHKMLMIMRMRDNAMRRLEQMKSIQAYRDKYGEEDVEIPYLDTWKEGKFLP